MKSKAILISLFVGVASLHAATAEAKDIYIDTTLGSDSNACTAENAPCASFSGAEGVVESGDDIYVTGSLSGGLFLNNSFRGTSEKELTIQPWDDKDDPVMTIGSGELSGLSIGGDFVTVSGFSFIAEGNATSFSTSADNVTLQNSTISGTGFIPISISGGTGNRLLGNTIEAGLFGISITGTEHTISKNSIYCAVGEKCNTAVNMTTADSFLVTNNAVWGFTEATTEDINPIAFALDSNSADAVIANNTTHNVRIAIATAGSPGAVIRNNIFSMEDGQHAYSYTSAGGFIGNTSADYNDYYLGGENSGIASVDSGSTVITSLVDWRAATGFDTNSISADPLFTDASSSVPDLSLTSTSPAIDAGVDFPGVVDDINGKARPAGDAYDMGAYEFGSDSDSVEVDAPTNIVVSPIGVRKATVNWSAPDLVSYYEIEYSYQNNFSTSKTATNITGTSRELTKRKSNKKTWFRIRTAYVSDSVTYYSDWTEAKGFLTKPAPPKKVFPATGSRIERLGDGDFLVTLKISFKNRKTHPRQKLKAIVNVKKGSKKITFRKANKAKLSKKQQFKVKKKGKSQTKQFVIPEEHIAKKVKFQVRFKRNANRQSKWIRSKAFPLNT